MPLPAAGFPTASSLTLYGASPSTARPHPACSLRLVRTVGWRRQAVIRACLCRAVPVMENRLVNIGKAARMPGITPETLRKGVRMGEWLPTCRARAGTCPLRGIGSDGNRQ